MSEDHWPVGGHTISWAGPWTVYEWKNISINQRWIYSFCSWLWMRCDQFLPGRPPHDGLCPRTVSETNPSLSVTFGQDVLSLQYQNENRWLCLSSVKGPLPGPELSCGRTLVTLRWAGTSPCYSDQSGCPSGPRGKHWWAATALLCLSLVPGL